MDHSIREILCQRYLNSFASIRIAELVEKEPHEPHELIDKWRNIRNPTRGHTP